jgi:8-oxo-dGTP pyrophosphatase MutT (NUDIX family)
VPATGNRVKTRSEVSAGGVVFRRTPELEIALASRRTRRGDLAWGLPKGLVEPGEEPEAAALREVREETGLEARIERPLGDINYWYVWEGQRVKKKVTFFLMEATGGDVSLHDHEMEEIRWFPLGKATRAASYRSEQDVLRRAVEALDATSA